MKPLDPPPNDFAKLTLVTIEVAPASLVRLASAKHLSSDPFRRNSRFRFDAPDGSFGVLYAAFDLETAFVETIVRAKAHPLPAGEPLLIERETLALRYVTKLSGRVRGRTLHLVQLHGSGLPAVKTDNQIATVDDYPTTQQWAKAFHDHPETVDGIIYMSRYLGDRRSVVFFDRARDAIEFGDTLPLLHHPELAQLLDTYHVNLILPVGKNKQKKRKQKARKKKRKRAARQGKRM
jgi:hypothetical protein